jgi:hypothetical protein
MRHSSHLLLLGRRERLRVRLRPAPAVLPGPLPAAVRQRRWFLILGRHPVRAARLPAAVVRYGAPKPGFPFWPSRRREGSRACTPVQPFSAFCTTSDLVPPLLRRSPGVPHRAPASFVLGSARFGYTSPSLPPGSSRSGLAGGSPRHPPGAGNASSRFSISPNSLRLRCPSASNSQ